MHERFINEARKLFTQDTKKYCLLLIMFVVLLFSYIFALDSVWNLFTLIAKTND